MIQECIVDTNVAVVANARDVHAGPDCVIACIDALDRIRSEECLLVDDQSRIIDEYRRHLSPAGQPGAGDAFFKWLWENQGNAERCRRVRITLESSRGFEEFPDDPALAGFHRDDRKFVAVALACGTAPRILNASDTDWWQYRAALKSYGLRIEFICPELMRTG